jgi:CHAT domain-containing protein
MFGSFVFLLSAFIFISPLGAQSLRDITPLEPGKPVTGQLSGGQEHSYQITLRKGEFGRLTLDQINIDLALTLQELDGKQIAVSDQESRNQGREKFDFVADKTASYRLDIRPTLKSGPAGRYEIRLDEIRTATERDRLLFNAHQSFLEAERLEEEGNFDDALPLGEQTLQISEQTWGTESEEYSRALNLIANIHTGKKDYAKAEPFYQRALKIREGVLGAEHPDVATSCNNMARLYSSMEDTAKAEAFALRALTIREKALDSNHFYTGYALLDYGRYLFDAEKYGQAEEILQRAVFILEKSLSEDHAKYALALHSLGYLHDTIGDFSAAIELYRRELSSAEKAKGKDSLAAAKVLNYIARVNYRRGEYDEAEVLYQRALDINTKLNDENGILVAQSNLANIHTERGDYERSEAMYKEILERREKAANPIPMRIAHALVNLGEINNSKGDYVAAEAYLKRSMSIVQDIWKEDTSELGDVLTRLATAYIGKVDYTAAEQVSRRALAIFEKIHGPNHPHVAEALNLLGQIALLKAEYDAAEPLFRRALAITEKAEGMNAPALQESLNGLADIYAGKVDIPQAMDFQSRANAVVEHHLALAIATGSERQKLNSLLASASNMDRNIAFHIGKAPADSKAAELAATTVLRFKGRVLDSMADTISSLRRRSNPKDRDLLDQLNDSTSKLAQRLLYAPELVTSAESQALEEKIENLQDEMSRRSAEFASQKQPVTLDSIRRVIPDGAVLVEFALYRSTKVKGFCYVAYVIRNQGEIQWKELGPSEGIDQSVDNLRKALRDVSRKDVNQLSRTLHERILQPILPFLEDAEQLLISPDGELNLIPFEALVDQQNGYLVESFLCSYLTSGRDLLRLQVARDSKSVPTVVANPTFGEPDAKIAKGPGSSPILPNKNRRSVTTGSDLSEVYFAPLAGTGQEARTIKKFFIDANIILGKEATETRLKQMDAPQILHIATHGFFLTDMPGGNSTDAKSNARIENPLLRSGLAFTGANVRKQGNDDGILTALEASGLNLWGTRLVTLSACDTGVGAVKTGEGVYGLRRAFFLSGTESLVMSLWPVSDYITREMMTDYYKGLKQGLGRGEALRQVQLGMLKRKGREHPFYWASFIQSGEWANLNGKR